MDDHTLTIKTVRDGPSCALVLSGDLDLSATDEFLGQAALAIDNQTERLVLDLAGVTFLDCVGAQALAIAASFAPSGCPVIIGSLSPRARRILELMDLYAEDIRHLLAATGSDPDG
jgi:anti-anti-sigma factor